MYSVISETVWLPYKCTLLHFQRPNSCLVDFSKGKSSYYAAGLTTRLPSGNVDAEILEFVSKEARCNIVLSWCVVVVVNCRSVKHMRILDSHLLY